MKEYLKILISIITSLMFLATLVSVVIGVLELAGDRKFESMIFPYLVGAIGSLVFGIVGTVTWFSALVLISSGKSEYTFKSHVFSSLIATLLTVTLVSLILAGRNFEEFIQSLVFFLFVVPVVVGSLVSLKLLFYRHAHNK